MYKKPNENGYLGSIEDEEKNCIGFMKADGDLAFRTWDQKNEIKPNSKVIFKNWVNESLDIEIKRLQFENEQILNEQAQCELSIQKNQQTLIMKRIELQNQEREIGIKLAERDFEGFKDELFHRQQENTRRAVEVLVSLMKVAAGDEFKSVREVAIKKLAELIPNLDSK